MPIRPATVEDIPAMHACRDEAIKEKAKGFYTPEVIEDWLTKDNPEIFKKDALTIKSDEWFYILYELDGQIYGMANASPEQKILGRVYARRGAAAPVGQLLLDKLVSLCRDRGCPYLDFDASLNSRAFYERNGALSLGETVYKTRSGTLVPCVKMRLVL